MKTWKTLIEACRSRKSGRFASKGRCKAYKKTKVKAATKGRLFW